MTTRPEPDHPTVDPELAMASDIAAAVEAYLIENPPGDVTEIIAAPVGFDLADSAGLGVVDGDVASWAVPEGMSVPGGTPFITWETTDTAVGPAWTNVKKWTLPAVINGVNTPTLVHTVGMGDLAKGVRVAIDFGTDTGPHDRIVGTFNGMTTVVVEPVPNSRDVTEIIAAPVGFSLAASAGYGVVDGDIASWAVPDALPLPGGLPFITWETAETTVGIAWVNVQKWTLPETINGVNTPTLVHTVDMGDLMKGIRVLADLGTSTGPHDRIVTSPDGATAVAAEQVPNSRDIGSTYTVWTPAFAGPTKAIDFQAAPVAMWARPLPAVLPAAGIDVEVTAWIGNPVPDNFHEVLTHPDHDLEADDDRIEVAVKGASTGDIAGVPTGAPILFCEVHPQGYVAPEGQPTPEAPTKLYANMGWTPGVRATFRVTYDPIAGRMQAWALAPWEADDQTPDGRWWTLCGTAEGDDLIVVSPTDGGIEWDLLGGFDTGRSCGGVGGTKVEQVVVRDLAWGTPIAWLDVAGLTVGDETYTDPIDDVAWDTTAEGGALVAWVPFAPGV